MADDCKVDFETSPKGIDHDKSDKELARLLPKQRRELGMSDTKEQEYGQDLAEAGRKTYNLQLLEAAQPAKRGAIAAFLGAQDEAIRDTAKGLVGLGYDPKFVGYDALNLQVTNYAKCLAEKNNPDKNKPSNGR